MACYMPFALNNLGLIIYYNVFIELIVHEKKIENNTMVVTVDMKHFLKSLKI